MSFMRTASPPEPPADWLERLQDLAQVKNVLNGDTCILTDRSPASRLVEFFSDPTVSEAWQKFNEGRPRL